MITSMGLRSDETTNPSCSRRAVKSAPPTSSAVHVTATSKAPVTPVSSCAGWRVSDEIAPTTLAIDTSSSVMPGGRHIAVNVTLRDLVRSAYDVPDAEIVGGAPWTRQMRFDLQARAEGEWPLDRFRTAVRPMLRGLLAERFGLKVHEDRRVPGVYALKR